MGVSPLKKLVTMVLYLAVESTTFNTCSQCITWRSCAKDKRLSDTLRCSNDSKIPRFQTWRGVLDAFVVLSKFRDGKEGKTGKTVKAKSSKPRRYATEDIQDVQVVTGRDWRLISSKSTISWSGPDKEEPNIETGRNKDSKTNEH